MDAQASSGMSGAEPTVSVSMLSYNHERFIAQAVDGVLAQETPFDVELVIGDDGSSDRTPEILRSYAERFPARVRVLDLGMHHGMTGNLARTLAALRGRYVAICDGDDFWIDSAKLAKQVAYLEAHPSCAMTFHNAFVEYADGRRELFNRNLTSGTYRGADLIAEWIVPSASPVFRNIGLAELPEFVHTGLHWDLALWLLAAETGDVVYLDDVMSVYRRHSAGVTQAVAGVADNNEAIAFYSQIGDSFNGRYRDAVAIHIAALQRSNAIHLVSEGERRAAWRQLRSSWRSRRPSTPHELRESAQAGLGVLSPRAYRAVMSTLRDGR